MHPELEKVFESFSGLEIQLKQNDLAYEIAECKKLEARIETIEDLLIAFIAEKEFKEEEEIRYEYEGLLAKNLAENISEFIGKYGTGNSKKI